MAVPRNRHSSARARSRRSHSGIKERTIVPCRSCNNLIRTHCVCYFCGFYKNKILKDLVSFKPLFSVTSL